MMQGGVDTMRVLHVTNAYPYPDVPEYGIFIKEQVDALRQAGVSCDLIFINGRAGGKLAYLAAVAEIRRKARQADVIHCHHLYSGLATALALTGKPVVLSFLNDWLHEMDEVGCMTLRRAVCNFGVRWATRTVFKSPIPNQFVDNPRIVHLPNGVDARRFDIGDKGASRCALGLDPQRRYALFVSSKDRDRRQKRYDRFRATLDILASTAPELDLEELVLVNQPRERVLDFFSAADLHLMTSDFEGSPNSVKEALSCGLAVVSTPVGNVKDLLSGVPGCHVAQDFEPPALARLVRRSLIEGVPREAVRTAFLKKAFSQEDATRQLVSLYHEIAHRP
jgi:glycosyltransferase involved in cell wall biosynthesis